MIENPKPQTVPWTLLDSWIGVLLFVLIDILLISSVVIFSGVDFSQNEMLVAFELVYLLPVATVFLWRPNGWKFLGFRKFTWAALGLGCGLTILGYSLIFLHNSLLVYFDVHTQGDVLLDAFAAMEQPGWFLFAGIIVAPLVEEIFFRGFLFQGFRERMGWLRAALLSSSIFAVGHLDPAAFVPTFILGFTFAFLFHRSNSIWPGMILHFLVNSFGLCVALFVSQYSGMLP